MIGGFLLFALLCSVGAIANLDVAVVAVPRPQRVVGRRPRRRAGQRGVELRGERDLRLAAPARRLREGRPAVLKDAVDSLNDIASPPFRKVVVKSLALTAAALLIVWFGLDRLALYFVDVQPPWLATLIAWLIGLSLVVGAVLLAAPVASLVASLFLDEIAAHVEARDRPVRAAGPRRRRSSRRRWRRCASPGCRCWSGSCR